MLSLRVEENPTAPTILQMEPLLEWSDEPVEVRWENTKQEVRVLKKYSGRNISLIVPNLVAMERAASLLGLDYVIGSEMVMHGAATLNKADGKWREFSQRTGPYLARGTLMLALSNKIRRGGDIPRLRKTIVENVLDHVSPVDMDALYILREKGARV